MDDFEVIEKDEKDDRPRAEAIELQEEGNQEEEEESGNLRVRNMFQLLWYKRRRRMQRSGCILLPSWYSAPDQLFLILPLKMKD